MTTDRGEYRAIHCVIMDGPDFQRLSGFARAVWYPTRLATGPTGIAVIPAFEAVTAERTGWESTEIRSAINELVMGDWVAIEQNVVWVVRGLEFEPSLLIENPNHRKFVAKTLESLPRLPIVERFKSRYANWLAGTSIDPAVLPPDRIGNDPQSTGDQIQIDRRLQPPPPPLPELQPPPDGGAGSARARATPEVRAATAANRGSAENPDTRVRLDAEAHPLRPDQFTQPVEDWQAAGVSIETIEATVRELARDFKANARSPRIASPLYFDRAIRQTLSPQPAASRSQSKQHVPRLPRAVP